MNERWLQIAPGLGIAFGAAAGLVVYLATSNILYVGYGSVLGLVLGAVASLAAQPATS